MWFYSHWSALMSSTCDSHGAYYYFTDKPSSMSIFSNTVCFYWWFLLVFSSPNNCFELHGKKLLGHWSKKLKLLINCNWDKYVVAIASLYLFIKRFVLVSCFFSYVILQFCLPFSCLFSISFSSPFTRFIFFKNFYKLLMFIVESFSLFSSRSWFPFSLIGLIFLCRPLSVRLASCI